MALVGAVLLLELCARIVVPEVTGEFGDDARAINLALMLWMQGVVVVAAYASLQSDRVMDDVGWLVGLAFVLVHGAWHVGTYDEPVPARRGDVGRHGAGGIRRHADERGGRACGDGVAAVDARGG